MTEHVNEVDHYKCTRIEDHKAGKHGRMLLWWCELCMLEYDPEIIDPAIAEEWRAKYL